MTSFCLKKYTFLGVFLNLHRGKTVKYFLISLLQREIKPFIYQTKKPELSIRPVA
jgi:hypothetical protein